MSELKTLIVCRHAHRDKDEGDDNGLSKKGQKQAERLAKAMHDKYSREDAEHAWLLSSPKRRCMETLEPLAKTWGREIEAVAMLDEGGDLFGKVDEFFYRWKTEAPALTVACSHGDWLPVALERMLGAEIHFSKGAAAEIQLVFGKPRLVWLIQEF